MLANVTKFPVEKLSTSEVINRKAHRGGGGGGVGGKHPSVLLGLSPDISALAPLVLKIQSSTLVVFNGKTQHLPYD